MFAKSSLGFGGSGGLKSGKLCNFEGILLKFLAKKNRQEMEVKLTQ